MAGPETGELSSLDAAKNLLAAVRAEKWKLIGQALFPDHKVEGLLQKAVQGIAEEEDARVMAELEHGIACWSDSDVERIIAGSGSV